MLKSCVLFVSFCELFNEHIPKTQESQTIVLFPYGSAVCSLFPILGKLSIWLLLFFARSYVIYDHNLAFSCCFAIVLQRILLRGVV
jgi:hypothetical protein